MYIPVGIIVSTGCKAKILAPCLCSFLFNARTGECECKGIETDVCGSSERSEMTPFLCSPADPERYPQSLCDAAREESELRTRLGLPRPSHRAESPGSAEHHTPESSTDQTDRSGVRRVVDFPTF